jgi:uncharacterized membrane protein YqjE
MPASRAGLFDSLRQLLATALAMAQVRLELLVADLELEKMRLVDVALRALLGLMLLGLGLVLLAAFVLMIVGEAYRLHALGVLTLLCMGGGLLLLQAAKRRLHDDGGMLAATRSEVEQDHAALDAQEGPR